MAQLGTAEAANRYDGLGTGPRFLYTFETQTGVPVDGTNSLLRELSPFTLRLIPPDALIEAAAGGDVATAVDLITKAAQGSDQNTLADQLATVSAIGAGATTLESFISSGQFLADQASDYFVTLSDALTAADIALQLQRILDAPVLTMLVNPNNMTINYTNLQSYASRTRYGFSFERWGEDQPTISFSGSTGAFIAGASDAPGTDATIAQLTGQTESPSGVQFASKRDSAAFQNLTALLHFFKSNGYIYDTVRGTEAHQFIGAVAIDYDQWTYVGHIESFDYSYRAEMPHRIEWSMEFKVDRMFDNATPTPVVLPQKAPTESALGSRPTGRTGDYSTAVAGATATNARSATGGTETSTMPFELLGPEADPTLKSPRTQAPRLTA
jgi:hypothetical protein